MQKRIKIRHFLISWLCVLSIMISSNVIFGYAKSSKSATATTIEQIHEIFPESYWSGLDALITAHPTWKFIAFNTGFAWSDCFTAKAELYPTRNLAVAKNSKGKLYYPTSWYSTTISGSYNWAGNSWSKYDNGNWYQASEEAIAYCMDPRNFFTETQIFQFLDSGAFLEGESAQNAAFKILNGVSSKCWSKTGEESNLYYIDESKIVIRKELVPDETAVVESGSGEEQKMKEVEIVENDGKVYLTYTEALCKIAKELGMSQLNLASRLRQEQGNGTSALISGTRSFTLADGTVIDGGYYNFFNIGASGSTNAEVVENGLRTAYKNGWDTKYKALLGGAKVLYNNYIARGQSTIYSQKWNVDSNSSRVFWGQYMGNITAPQTECSMVCSSMTNAGAIDTDLIFLIPVFSDMPESCPKPTKDGNPNYKIGSIKINDTTISGFSADKLTYDITLDSATSEFDLDIIPYASTSSITVGDNTAVGSFGTQISIGFETKIIAITCTAENKDTKTYVLNITRPNSAIVGDLNGDNSCDVFDAAIIYSHILGTSTLSDSEKALADINKDNEIDVFDAAEIFRIILAT